RDLDRGETFQMDVRPNLFEAAQQIRVVAPRQIGMQTVDDVDFGERLMGALPQLVPRLFERERVRAGIAWLQPGERAEQATGDADVRRFEADVVVVEGAGAVALLALAVREPPDHEQIATLEKAHSIGEIETVAGCELLLDIREAGRAEARLRKCQIFVFGASARADRRAPPSGCAATDRGPLRRR